MWYNQTKRLQPKRAAGDPKPPTTECWRRWGNAAARAKVRQARCRSSLHAFAPSQAKCASEALEPASSRSVHFLSRERVERHILLTLIPAPCSACSAKWADIGKDVHAEQVKAIVVVTAAFFALNRVSYFLFGVNGLIKDGYRRNMLASCVGSVVHCVVVSVLTFEELNSRDWTLFGFYTGGNGYVLACLVLVYNLMDICMWQLACYSSHSSRRDERQNGEMREASSHGEAH